MKVSKLFKVLVTGGALLATPGCQGDTDSDEAELLGMDEVDSGTEPEHSSDSGTTPAPADASTAPVDDAGQLVNGGFCPNDVACEVIDGNSVLRAGFECCWSTSC